MIDSHMLQDDTYIEVMYHFHLYLLAYHQS